LSEKPFYDMTCTLINRMVELASSQPIKPVNTSQCK